MNEINQSANTAPPITSRLVVPFRAAPGSIKAAHARTDSPEFATTSAPDEVSFSDAALALASTDSATERSGSDGVRVAKVARIRSDIQTGVYDIDGKIDVVVDQLLDELAG